MTTTTQSTSTSTSTSTTTTTSSISTTPVDSTSASSNYEDILLFSKIFNETVSDSIYLLGNMSLNRAGSSYLGSNILVNLTQTNNNTESHILLNSTTLNASNLTNINLNATRVALATEKINFTKPTLNSTKFTELKLSNNLINFPKVEQLNSTFNETNRTVELGAANFRQGKQSPLVITSTLAASTGFLASNITNTNSVFTHSSNTSKSPPTSTFSLVSFILSSSKAELNASFNKQLYLSKSKILPLTETTRSVAGTLIIKNSNMSTSALTWSKPSPLFSLSFLTTLAKSRATTTQTTSSKVIEHVPTPGTLDKKFDAYEPDRFDLFKGKHLAETAS